MTPQPSRKLLRLVRGIYLSAELQSMPDPWEHVALTLRWRYGIDNPALVAEAIRRVKIKTGQR